MHSNFWTASMRLWLRTAADVMTDRDLLCITSSHPASPINDASSYCTMHHMHNISYQHVILCQNTYITWTIWWWQEVRAPTIWRDFGPLENIDRHFEKYWLQYRSWALFKEIWKSNDIDIDIINIDKRSLQNIDSDKIRIWEHHNMLSKHATDVTGANWWTDLEALQMALPSCKIEMKGSSTMAHTVFESNY